MPSTIGHKRQRADLDDDTIALSTIARDATDIRNSLRSLHKALPQLGDITVSVQLSGEHEAHNFPCISALLASASRPLAAMLFGPMADASGGLSRPRDQRILRLSGTEPWCFEQMLSFIHGHHLCAPPGSCSCNPSLPQPFALFLFATVYLPPLSALSPSLSSSRPPIRPPTRPRRPRRPRRPSTLPPPSQPRLPSSRRVLPCAAAALTMDTAVQLHHVADYYEVTPCQW